MRSWCSFLMRITSPKVLNDIPFCTLHIILNISFSFSLSPLPFSLFLPPSLLSLSLSLSLSPPLYIFLSYNRKYVINLLAKEINTLTFQTISPEKNEKKYQNPFISFK